jgi:hypothetical protein
MNPYNLVMALGAGFYALLWLGGVVSYLFLGGPPEGSEWAAPAFLALAAGLAWIVLPAAERWVLPVAALAGFAAEALGVATGFPFGRYQYTETLSPSLCGVPMVMAAAWSVLIVYARQMTPSPVRGAAWMTAMDLVIDPMAAGRLGYWAWEGTGPYYGIPWTNFAGWFFVSWILLAAIRKPPVPSPAAAWLGLSLVLFFTAIALGSGLFGAGAVGLGLFTMHAVQARATSGRSARSKPVTPLR